MMAGAEVFDVKITGIKEWELVAKVLPERIVAKVSRKAVRKGINVFKAAMKRNVAKHRISGELDRSITTKVKTYANRNVVYAATGPEYSRQPHAHLVEFGHRMVTSTGRVVGQVPPHPFARTAEDANAATVLALVSHELVRETEAELNRMVRVR